MKPLSWDKQPGSAEFDGDTGGSTAGAETDAGCPGQFGILCGNWGDRKQERFLWERMHFDLKSGPCSIVMLQEAAGHVLDHMREPPSEEEHSTDTETRGGGAPKSDRRRTAQYYGIRGPETGTSVMIAARKSHVSEMRMRLFRLRHDGLYKVKNKKELIAYGHY